MKTLNFVGTGNCTNTVDGNTSAYFELANRLFIIDCGQDTFVKYKKILDEKEYKEVVLMITHTHCDHVGSLGSLALYLFYEKGIKLSIKVASSLKFQIDLLCQIFGCSHCVDIDGVGTKLGMSYGNSYKDEDNYVEISYIETEHYDMEAFLLLLKVGKVDILYTGDTGNIFQVENLLDNIPLDEVYIEGSNMARDGGHLDIVEVEALLSQYPSIVVREIIHVSMNKGDENV